MAEREAISSLFGSVKEMRAEIRALQQDNKILKEENKDLKLKVVKIQQDITHIYATCPSDPHEVHRQINS